MQDLAQQDLYQLIQQLPLTNTFVHNELHDMVNISSIKQKKANPKTICKYCNLTCNTNIIHSHLRKHIYFCDIPYCGFVASSINEIKNHYFKHNSIM